MSGWNGAAIFKNAYDEYGNPQGGAITGRFGYTGQAWLPEIALQYSKARMYSPALGRFLQTDPIGPADDANLYAYTGNDPVNNVDPTGLAVVLPPCAPTSVCVTAPRLQSSAPNEANSLETRNIRGKVASVVRTDDGPQNKLPPCRPSPTDLENSGAVTFRYSEFNVSALGTSGDAFGAFRTSKGYYGTFHTSFDGVFVGGRGVGVSYGAGSSQSLSTFSGVNYNVVATLGPYSISDNFDPNTGAHVGQTDAGSTLGLGIGGTRSNTTLVTVSCPR